MSANYIEKQISGHSIRIETGKYAKQADGSCLVTFGKTMVLATAVSSKEPPKEFMDFFPLTVNYQERFYAVGKIPGGFMKREGRPSVHETLISRLIDRTIRPLFPKDYKQETQVIITTINADREDDLAAAGLLAASCALSLSDIPFKGPIAGVRIGRVDSNLIALPTADQMENSDLDLLLAGGKGFINMIESASNELSEDEMVRAIMFGEKQLAELVDMQNEITVKAGKEKREYVPADISQEIVNKIGGLALFDLRSAVNIKEKLVRNSAIDKIRKDIIEKVSGEFEEDNIENKTKAAFEDIVKEVIRVKIMSTGIRIDGRGLDDVRPISCEVGILPRAHGSAVFTRGETQALVVTALGSKEDMQIIDNIEGDRRERFMLHYNFPPFATGEVKRLGPPGRREIGHGMLAQKALTPMIPYEEDFPYAIRVVSDILESNGSSSMATVCGATLSLMDAGVHIKSPVSGIAMGLIKVDSNYYILTDILGDEDHYGDMDFKVAGTKNGITALQMDIKIDGINAEILNAALNKAKKARLYILDKMTATLPEVRDHLSKYAPKIAKLTIDSERIKNLIGPGGKTIKSIIDETGVKIDISQDGSVNIFGDVDADMEKALEMVKEITTIIKEGDIYEGVVSRVESYGAFVKLLGKQEGLLHISQISQDRIDKVSDVLKVGDAIKVKVTGVDKFGRISVSRKALLLNNQ